MITNITSSLYCMINSTPTGRQVHNTHNGCKLLIPHLSATAPVINGINALPACPNPASQPMAPVRIQGGSTLPEWFIVMGYMGPRRRPMMDTVTASPMSEGVNQTTSSRLEEGILRGWTEEEKAVCSPNDEGSVEEHDSAFAYLRNRS